MKIVIFRRYRSSRFGYEWHNHGGVKYLHVWVGHPRRHAWWALSVYVYI